MAFLKTQLHGLNPISVNKNLKQALTLVIPVLQGSSSRFLFLLYINDLPQAALSNSLFYADNTCIVFQPKSVIKIEKQLTKDFSNLCYWFVDNKLSIHFQYYLILNINFGILSP